ncbi:hypothetical protein FD02_GL001632 [Lacticaseibacillus nasuensis JCM 17158]|uniref:Uncharacterized protein n=1 Tax=Lacticaseibacillus nasuensis JCM 17158 TaxID=1291734 RepID=A0A0R1JTU7_9LACO|nr:hypothetical protein FD02_GL001632 [Lacticaseibacillus nasuensis JCM 17158]
MSNLGQPGFFSRKGLAKLGRVDILIPVVAAMAELADAQCSGRCEVILVQVRLLFAALAITCHRTMPS